MFSGIIQQDNRDYSFEYKNDTLSILFNNSDYCKKWFNVPFLKGEYFPYKDNLIFYLKDSFYYTYGLNYYKPNMILKYGYCESKSCFIKKIKFELDELDYSYNNELTKKIQEFELKHSQSNSNLPLIHTILESSQDDLDMKFPICIQKKDMNFSINYSYSYSNSVQPYSFHAVFSIYYDFDEDYDLIYETIESVRNLFSFLNYRRNIHFKNITPCIFNDRLSLYEPIGSISYYPHLYEENADLNYIKRNFLPYSVYEKFLPTIFQNIVSERVGLRYLPHSHLDKDEYSPERIIMIASTFEREFELLFHNKIEHKIAANERRNKIKDLLENLIVNNNLNLTEKKEIQRLIKSLDFVNFSSKVNEVLKKYRFIELYLKDLYESNNKTYIKANFSESLQTLRNSVAHYKIDYVLTDSRQLIVKGLEMMVLMLQLIDCGMDEDNINFIVSRL